ncbi:hypothetical protein A2U01_0087568, partial [Trifolium medium]|nr:hypothetical protein [Trifolium medium]
MEEAAHNSVVNSGRYNRYSSATRQNEGHRVSPRRYGHPG